MEVARHSLPVQRATVSNLSWEGAVSVWPGVERGGLGLAGYCAGGPSDLVNWLWSELQKLKTLRPLHCHAGSTQSVEPENDQQIVSLSGIQNLT